MITVIESKQILESDAEAIVNFVTCSGEVINFNSNKLFDDNPEMHNKYLAFCKDGKLKPGMVWPYKTDNQIILNCVVSLSNDVSDVTLEVLKECISKLVKTINTKNIKRIAISNIVQLINIIDFDKLYDEFFYDSDIVVEYYKYNIINDTTTTPLSKKNTTQNTPNNLIHMTYPENTIFHI